MTEPEDDICPQCQHLFEPHMIVATTYSDGKPVPTAGGIVLCNIKGCKCFNTWGFQGAPALNVPNDEVIEIMREDLQDD